MVFEFNGNTYTVTDCEPNGDKLVFKFLGVVPQMIGENIKATLYATNGGTLESVEKTTYSVKQYCVNTLKNTAYSSPLRPSRIRRGFSDLYGRYG